MSWLNNSLNTIKGQLSTLAHEIMEETAGPGDEEYRGPPIDTKTAVEMLADTQREKEDLDKLCSEKELEIVTLRKQIETLQNQISDTGGGGGSRSSGAGGSGGATGSGRTSKTPTDNNASTLEDSWCWEPDNAKTDNDHSSETSSGNGNEMVNIILEETALGASAKSTHKTKIQRLGGGPSSQNSELQTRVQQLEEENKQLNSSLEELDTQHNVAMQNMLELKTDLQEKLMRVSKDYEALKKAHEEKFISTELELAKMLRQNEAREHEKFQLHEENEMLKQKLEESSLEIRKALEEISDLRGLLDKKDTDNKELIERIREASQDAQQQQEDLNQKLEMLTKELEDLKTGKTKKTSESSNSSSGKQSEDEFIVVREQDANSSAAATPPSKEELKDRIVQLENSVSELTLENGSLVLKLQDREMEKELSLKVLKENMQILQSENDELNEKLRMSLLDLEDQQFKIDDLKERASEAVIAQEQLKALGDEKLKIAQEIGKMKESFKESMELEKRLIISEQEKETLQLELQSLKTNLEQKMQNLTYENQQLKLNAEAETETVNNNNELEQKLKDLNAENETLKAELERVTEFASVSRPLREKKQCVTDLDEDDNDDDSFSLDKLRNLLKAFSSADLKEANLADCEQFYKNIKEKLAKIDTLQREAAHMSAEVMELQDSKLVWDHEKKTLEADISQYILQCDELMKNNEILLNELENYKRNKLETIHENNEENIVQLESQLDECNKLNRTLEQEYMELNEKIDELEKENQALSKKLRDTQHNYESLATKEKDLNLQVETLELEKCNLLLKLNDIDSKAEDLQQDSDVMREHLERCESLQKQLSSLAKDHADLVNAMQKQKDTLMETIAAKEELEKCLRERELSFKTKKEKDQAAQEEVQQKFKATLEEAAQYKQEMVAKDIVCESLKEEIKVLQTYVQGAEKLMEDKLVLEEQMLEKQQQIKELSEELQLAKEKQNTLMEELEQLRTEKQNAEQELQKSTTSQFDTSSAENIANIAKIAELEEKLLATADLQKSLDTLNFEKQEMIKALQQKHAENMQYYMEIQRLTPLVQLQQQQPPQPVVEQKPCEKCPTLEANVADLRKQQEKNQDQINFLKEKSDILTTNLLTEQSNQKLVQQEKADVMEQNANLRKDVERLRAHLLEIEDMHTQESVEMQKELEETKARMLALEEEVSKSSNAYTSASIRANQHAETLQAQYALLIQQRDELGQKLSQAEDRESKNQAALTNLQCALEQFQNDKEHDIKLSTQRIRKELQLHMDKEAQLHTEIQQLQKQLSDATQGLNAASRLSDQLESCQQTINVLREEVDSLKQHNSALEQKLSSTESSQSDKIEKTLIKSLLIGYVVSSNPNDKQQILRMISSVLDFNQSETDKVGLNKQQGGWLGALLGGGGGSPGAHSKDNLVQAFVQFLEQESQPQPQQQQMPNLLNITHSSQQTGMASSSSSSAQNSPATAVPASAQPSRRSSIISNPGISSANSATTNFTSPTPVPIQPLLLNSTVLDDFSPSRNSSSILKDILSDS